jgi:hypothetical protein
MGVKQSPDFAQEVMEDIFRDMLDVEVYINDIGIFAQSWEHHQIIVSEVLKLLEDNGFTGSQNLEEENLRHSQNATTTECETNSCLHWSRLILSRHVSKTITPSCSAHIINRQRQFCVDHQSSNCFQQNEGIDSQRLHAAISRSQQAFRHQYRREQLSTWRSNHARRHSSCLFLSQTN